MRLNGHTFFLLIYLLGALLYYFLGDGVRAMLFPVFLGVSVVSFRSLYVNRLITRSDLRVIPFFLILTVITFFLQILNDNLTPFVLYICSSYCIALLLIRGKINSAPIKFPLYLFAVICAVVFLSRGTIYNVFPAMSVNYVSVVF